ncbi:dephospho-CoA kinase [Magnetococcus marinus MC-1]|uniref:Dephospho-CoA kinase n=1 Tax=Magnetococcus marinus (strain ATCC BAA-1437 / JCM 17883 / MC-1) TaxID=156889 RepID=A0L3K6_MAGMM|nr:dephospho-CoA kinase [Magnetococcus marinus]ABK42549.1 dephospho-CoA kinase [Magnetococcus marinus MC-1]
MYLLGLTGSIGSGKSTVAAMLVERGARLLDSDRFAREALEPGTEQWHAVVARFGQDIMEEGEGDIRALDRRKLGQIVFADELARKDLESIVHPYVWRMQSKLLAKWAEEEPNTVVVIDIPLLFETNGEGRCDMAVVVGCGDQQWARLENRRGMSDDMKRRIIAQQMPEEEKIKRGDWVIWNTGTLDETEKQIGQLWNMVSLGAKNGVGEAWPDGWHKYGY